MTSPAEKYAAAKKRAAYPVFSEFEKSIPFVLDDFQIQACHSLEQGHGVLVCAPTGAGKTIVGEFAVRMALAQGRKCFYTTPIKALSNQKFHDLSGQVGAENVGLLTGDNAINAHAPIVVMTTEVLRNMLYAGSSALSDLGYVVMDEVHYLADRFRGAVWEEVIIHLPESVSLVSLSATVSNAEEFAEWLKTVRGHTDVIVSEVRPVPLWQHMMVSKRLYDLFADEQAARERRVHPELLRATKNAMQRAETLQPRYGGRRGPRRPRTRLRGLVPSRFEVIEQLEHAHLLPAITFIFSRAGCDAAVEQCLVAGLHLTNSEERAEIARIANERTGDLNSDDLHVLGYFEWLDGLERGIAAHHAGLLPVFKEIVEELFAAGLVKAVFATETLALGINMPARSVVLERLVKFNGEAHVDLTAGEYTQLTGRAGRRGIDPEGHAVVLWSPETEPKHVASLASTRTYPLKSSFSPSYNMAVNLVATVGASRAADLLESSFAQFQTDRAVVGLATKIRRNNDTLDSYASSMECDKGNFGEYAHLRVAIKQRERELKTASVTSRRAVALDAWQKISVGDVIPMPQGRRLGFAVVIDPDHQPVGEPRPLVLTEDRWAGRLTVADFGSAAAPVAKLRVPQNFQHRSRSARRELSEALRSAVAKLPPEVVMPPRAKSAAGDDKRLAILRREMQNHPCHQCSDREEHARWAERHHRLSQENERLQERAHHRTHSLARTFDQVCDVLTSRGYLSDEGVTENGIMLSRIWGEYDLLAAECIRLGTWSGLDPAELAAAVSPLVYESRGDRVSKPTLPKGRLGEALAQVSSAAQDLQTAEHERGLSLTRDPVFGFVWPVYRWARGEGLARALDAGDGIDGEMSAGDFVRWARQVADLLDQLASAPHVSAELRETARAAIAGVRKGVVAG